MDAFLADLRTLLRKVFHWFLSGLIILLPLGATLVLLGWILDFLNQLVGGESVFATIWTVLFGWFSLGPTTSLILGYFLLLIVIIVVGYFAQGFAKQRLGSILRSFFDQIPIVNKIYRSFEQLIGLWSDKKEGEDVSKVGEVVMVDFMNVKALGVLSSRMKYKMGNEEYYLVYLPSAPVPATGFTYFFKVSEVKLCGIKMDEMTKVVVSLGVLGREVMGTELKLESVEGASASPPEPVEGPPAA